MASMYQSSSAAFFTHNDRTLHSTVADLSMVERLSMQSLAMPSPRFTKPTRDPDLRSFFRFHTTSFRLFTFEAVTAAADFSCPITALPHRGADDAAASVGYSRGWPNRREQYRKDGSNSPYLQEQHTKLL
jgi:hypothetical protein